MSALAGLPCTVGHVADFYRRYPGEVVNLTTRVTVAEALPNYALRICLPAGLQAGASTGPARLGPAASPRFVKRDAGWDVLWTVNGGAEAGMVDEYHTEACVSARADDAFLASRAVVTVEPAERWPGHVEESVTLAVSAKSSWLRHLPALYDGDEFMGRFLMLFESFWAPIEAQIDVLPCFFDPLLTPPEFLPWLAGWLDLAFEGSWPEEKRRALLRSAARLYRRRGTRDALIEYLRIYTGHEAAITEYRARNFGMGAGARLGPGLALGRGNVPSTFVVAMQLPPIPAADDEERVRLEAGREQQIRAIIEAEKPAHTQYTLKLESM